MDRCTLRVMLLAVLVLCANTMTIDAFASEHPNCSAQAGSLPDPDSKPGTVNADIPIEHVLVIMEENHSFDNFLGRLNSFGYDGEVDGLTPELFNPDGHGHRIYPWHQTSFHVKNTEHGWDSSHLEWNFGANDGFVTENGGGDSGARAMGYYEATELPLLYSLANRFAISDRYFSSVMGPTWPNRYYLYAATSRGRIRNEKWIDKATPTIFELLSKYGVTWKYYYTDIPYVALQLPKMLENKALRRHLATVGQYRHDLERGTLPQVVFLESSFLLGDEHPPFDFRIGQREVAARIGELLKSKYWASSALFLSYDEHGGYYDHVSPPEACAPDRIAPQLDGKDKIKAGFDRYGFRVPFVAVSPYARRHFVSHVTYDHTSILKFIETKFNLPALTDRDANADAMLDLFDFEHPDPAYELPGRVGSLVAGE